MITEAFPSYKALICNFFKKAVCFHLVTESTYYKFGKASNIIMDKLWAPWRAKYIRGKKRKTCLFCHGRGKQANDYVIFKTKYSSAMLNLYPYNNGHLLISPLRHVARLDQLEDKEALDLFQALKRAQKLLDLVLKPQGYNIGLNLTRSAGAGITGHLHIHIVPRWIGDTNFMPTLFNTKIISESLDELYQQLKNAQSKTG